MKDKELTTIQKLEHLERHANKYSLTTYKKLQAQLHKDLQNEFKRD